MVFSAQNRKSEHHHQIQHIQTGTTATFHSKHTIFIFFGQICPKKVEKILLTENTPTLQKFSVTTIFTY